jgi:hypothetical protein
MKLNKKKLNLILPQIKAHLNVAVIADNSKYPGLIDFLFQLKGKEIEPGNLNKLTCDMSIGNDLFADTAIETLRKPFVVDIVRFRDALKGGGFETELKAGVANGINIQADASNFEMTLVGKTIDANWNSVKDFDFSGSVKFNVSSTERKETCPDMV